MEHLPTELLLEIFSYACVDGGYTGRSLSLVSKRINAVSEHVRYQTLAVYGTRHIQTFSFRLYSSRADSGLRNVRHLFLTDRSAEIGSGVDTDDKCSITPTITSTTARPESGAELVTNITFILTAVAPYLRTLLLVLTTLRKPTPLSLSVISFLSDLPFLPLIPTDLPVLRELTVAMPLTPDAFGHSKKALRLERLHIATHTELPITFGQTLKRIVPNLTHLRVSSLRGRTDGGGLLDLLKAVVHFPPKWNDALPGDGGSLSVRQQNQSSLVPRTLRRVLITPKPVTGSRGLSRVFGTLSQELRQICQDDTAGRILVVKTADCLKIDSDHEKMLYDIRYQKLKEEWLQRMHGGEGCWIEESGYVTYYRPEYMASCGA